MIILSIIISLNALVCVFFPFMYGEYPFVFSIATLVAGVLFVTSPVGHRPTVFFAAC